MAEIYTHISNFLDTWEGWFNVVNGLNNLAVYGGLSSVVEDLTNIFGAADLAIFNAISS